jgi:energy-coupling factor transporter transmembrane protein EcfT
VFALLILPQYVSSSLVLNVTANFFFRFVPVGFAADLLFSGDGASRMLAGLRKLHCPESAIMVCAVIFRFFPVLRNDMRISMQSVRTRSFFHGWLDKLKGIPAYLEILIVPMMFRVIRIAEYLAASAEARGISRKVRKYSYIECRIKARDTVLMVMLPILITAVLLIPALG